VHHLAPVGQTVGVEPILEAITVLVVEDDEGDARLVAELLEDAASRMGFIRSRSLAEALTELEGDGNGGVDCVLLDLGLPDASGLEALAGVRAAATSTAIIVLTGLDDEAAGIAAVNAGAQDYLVKGQVDAALLARAVRYAIGRRQAQDDAEQLRIAAVRAEENARLERGLAPCPIVADESIWIASMYRPGRRRAVLGGDFYDVVERSDGLHVLVGDVCGHGPDEAALGACLRIAWRALTLAGADGDLMLTTLERILEHESQIPGLFATLCTLAIEPSHRVLEMRRAGHPSPVLIHDRSVTSLPVDGGGPPIGVFAGEQWRSSRIELPTGWVLLLYTDGLIEGRVGPGSERLGEERLRELIAGYLADHPDWRDQPDGLLSALIGRAHELNGEELSDDVAMLLVGTRSSNPAG
jgi:serine phosphatase RsbU (regulator of sigma subunit)